MTIVKITEFQVVAQKRCSNEQYIQQQLVADPLLKNSMDQVEVFTESKLSPANQSQQRIQPLVDVINIPVVFHILYHTPDQNLQMDAIDRLINALNRDFNKKNFDTINIPPVFRPLATSMGFQFSLATQDPRGARTTGVVKKYTPVKYWMSDDKMKFSSSYGDDAWDTKRFM